MKEETNSINTQEHLSVARGELPFAATTVSAGVLIGAIGEPKVPPFSGD